MNPAAKDVYRRAGKTFVQTALPSITVAYAHYQSNHQAGLLWPGLIAGVVSAGAASLAVIWNGSTALLGARRARKLALIEAWGKRIVADALAAQAAATGVPTAVGPTP